MGPAAPAAGAARGQLAAAARDRSKGRGRRRRRSRPTPACASVAILAAVLPLLAARGARTALSVSSSAAGARSLVTATNPHAEDVLIGWKGETWQPGPVADADADAYGDNSGTRAAEGGGGDASSPADGRGGGAAGEKWVELLSWRPRAFLYHGFLSPAEADHIVRLAEGRVKRSGVVDAKTGKTKLDPIRTSTGAALTRGHDATVAEIERRVAEWTRLPASHAEAIQILRYENGQTYKAHWDWFDDPVHNKEAEAVGNRVATILLYLSEVEAGGATTLPLASPANATRAREAYPPPDPATDPSADAQCAGAERTGGGMGVAVRPKKGDALLFWDMLPDGKTVDRRALHASCPTLKGVKYTATVWVHSKRYGGAYEPLARAGRCEDGDARCGAWAREAPASRCDSQPEKMLGLAGLCRRACRDCEACAADDLLCLRANGRSRRAELLARDAAQGRREDLREAAAAA